MRRFRFSAQQVVSRMNHNEVRVYFWHDRGRSAVGRDRSRIERECSEARRLMDLAMAEPATVPVRDCGADIVRHMNEG